MFKWIRRLTTIAALTAMLVVVPQTSALAGQGSVADVRAATAKFHDVKVAMGAGYVHFLNCFDSAQGGMGQHYVNFDLLNGTLNANAPQAMVYEVEKNKLQLVAVEWIAPIQDPSNPNEAAPTLLVKRSPDSTSLACGRCTRGCGGQTRRGCSRTTTRP